MSGPLRGPLRKKDSHLWQREENDWYVEPSWTSERLFERIKFTGPVLDPSCGGGNIVRSARAAGLAAFGCDVVQRTDFETCRKIQSFMDADWSPPECFFDIVSNPPFGLADPGPGRPVGYVELAIARAPGRVAMLLPANWVQGNRRSKWLATSPLESVLFLAPRPSMPPGHVLAAGLKPGNGTTDYAWFIWNRAHVGPPALGWLRRDDVEDLFA